MISSSCVIVLILTLLACFGMMMDIDFFWCCYMISTSNIVIMLLPARLQLAHLGQMHQINFHLQNCTHSNRLGTWFKLPRCIMVCVSPLVSEPWYLYKWGSGGMKSQLYENLCSKLWSLDTLEWHSCFRHPPYNTSQQPATYDGKIIFGVVLLVFLWWGEFNLIDMSAV